MYLLRCSLRGVDGVRLYQLAKRLLDLSRDVTTSAQPSSWTPAETTLIEQALQRPGSTVRELRAATGFAQSHVSTTVARLRDRGLVETAPDPADRRTTQVRLTPAARRAIRRRARADASQSLRAAVGDPTAARRAEALLDELADLLLG